MNFKTNFDENNNRVFIYSMRINIFTIIAEKYLYKFIKMNNNF